MISMRVDIKELLIFHSDKMIVSYDLSKKEQIYDGEIKEIIKDMPVSNCCFQREYGIYKIFYLNNEVLRVETKKRSGKLTQLILS